jgi:hypothetical protein
VLAIGCGAAAVCATDELDTSTLAANEGAAIERSGQLRPRYLPPISAIGISLSMKRPAISSGTALGKKPDFSYISPSSLPGTC